MKKFMGGIVLMCTLTALSYAETIVHNGVTYGTITSPVTGKVWLDRNLGASRVCQSIDDEQCYGDYYQWGRGADGHEKANSSISTTQLDISYWNSNYSYTDSSDFIAPDGSNSQYVSAYDWANYDYYGDEARLSFWNKTDGSGVCPAGFRVPSKDELQAELIQSIKSSGENGNVYSEDENSTGAFNSFLKIPSAGKRKENGELIGQGQVTYLYANSVHRLRGEWVWQYYASMYNSSVDYYKYYKAQGVPVRCISYAPALNLVPTANPGQNQTVYEGNPVTFSATNSTDSDGEIVSYEWSENGVVLSNDVNFTKDDFSVGVHTITLKVTDDDNASSEATVTVTVNEFPKEELTSNGEYINTIDNIFTKRVYTFTLTEKSQVSIYANSNALKVAGWLLDENGTKISDLENWQSGVNNQFGYEAFLNKGSYTIEFFPQFQGESGDFSFTYTTKTYEDIMKDPWFINIPKHIAVAKNETINICLNVKANSGVTLDTEKLRISSDDLPDNLNIIIGYHLVGCQYTLNGKVETPDNFSVTLNITDGNITKEHKIDFSVESLIVDGIIGDGPSGEMAIRKSELNEYIPFKVAFNLKIGGKDIESVECLFGDNLDFGIDNVKKVLYTIQGKIDSYGKYICDAESAKHEDFIGVASGQQLMNRLISLDENERYMTVVVTLKDGTVLKKKILKKIPIIDMEKPIQLWYEKTPYINDTFGRLSIWRNNRSYEERYSTIDDTYVKTTKFNLDYGDEVTLGGGRWILRIGNHQMFMNLDEYTSKGLKFTFRIDENTEKDKTILELGYVQLGEKLDIYFQKTGHEKLAKWTRTFYVVPCVWTYSGHSEFEITDQDTETAVRGTTFKVSLTDHGADYYLYEGALDINKSGKTTNLKTMQSYQGDTGKVKEITNVSVPSTVKKYFDETSLATADINSTVSDMEVSTNSDKASFLLIGDHVRFGGGKVDLIKNIVEGNYTLRFLPLLWHKKPEDRNITFGKDNLKENITAEYQKLADVFVDGIAQDKKVDINVSSTNIRVDQLEDESLYLVTKINDKNSSLNFSTMNSTVNVEKNGTISTNIPLANDVRIMIDKSGKVKPHIDDALLPKEDLPLGTQIKVMGDKVRFVVPMDKTLNF